jgi:hypothetical protein
VFGPWYAGASRVHGPADTVAVIGTPSPDVVEDDTVDEQADRGPAGRVSLMS